MPRGQLVSAQEAAIYNDCLDAGLIRAIIPRMILHADFHLLPEPIQQIYQQARARQYNFRSPSWRRIHNRVKTIRKRFP